MLKTGFRKIAVTQPRRISSISLAKRVGYETLNLYGSEVAYKIRFDGNVTQRTRIVFLTGNGIKFFEFINILRSTSRINQAISPINVL